MIKCRGQVWIHWPYSRVACLLLQFKRVAIMVKKEQLEGGVILKALIKRFHENQMQQNAFAVLHCLGIVFLMVFNGDWYKYSDGIIKMWGGDNDIPYNFDILLEILDISKN